MKCFHLLSRNRVTSMFSSGDAQDIAAIHSHKTIQRRHQFCPKINLLNIDGTQNAGRAMSNVNGMLSAETTDENDNTITINVPTPKWNVELRDYQHDNEFQDNGFKVTLFELIALRFKRNDCVSNFWITRNRCGNDTNLMKQVF